MCIYQLCTILLLLCLATTHGSDITNAMPYQLALHEDRFSFSHPAFLGEGGSSVQRRVLKQEDDSACVWESDRDSCRITIDTARFFLKTADNPIAHHVYRKLECIEIDDEHLCTILECAWINGRCILSFKENREFLSAPCLKKARHVIDASIGMNECFTIATKKTCAEMDSCYWNEAERCAFDKWYYYFGIRTEGAFPEGTAELLRARTTEIDLAIEVARETAEISAWGDLIDWDPPAFDCPSSSDPLLCTYVETLTPLITHIRYCFYEYTPPFDATSCAADAYCMANPENPEQPCGPDHTALLPAFRQADMEFAKAIKDPEARAYEMKNVECQYTTDETECLKKDACTWVGAEKYCDLSAKWIEEEKYRLVGKEKDPTCKYFVLNVEQGCLDLETQDACASKPTCFYEETTELCSIAHRGQVEYALSLAESLDTFVVIADTCTEANEEEACTDVTLESGADKEGGRRGRYKKGKKNLEEQFARPSEDEVSMMEEIEGHASVVAPASEETVSLDFEESDIVDDIEFVEDEEQG